MRPLLLLLGTLTVVIVLMAGALTVYLGPYFNRQGRSFVEIERGMSSQAIARTLEERGIVRSRWAFLAVRLLHPRAGLQAGEYRFEAEQTPFQVFDKIHRGEIFYEQLTVPEGSNIFDIAEMLRHSDTVAAPAFLQAASDPRPIRDLDPQAPSLEGYLFPSTYRVTHKTTAQQLCREMTGEFRKQWKQLIAGRAPSRSVHQIVTLASLVEKEAAAEGERPEVASVFLNRLKLSMPLQCDPTTIYAALVENRYRGTIHRSDLASVNPYNTYTHTGLPPGPIANPGLRSLRAALHPADTTFLYFVAKPNGVGSHVFSSSLAEHEKAVLAYRKGKH